MRILLTRLNPGKKFRSGLFLNITLSFLAGYVDSLGFMALFGVFTAHITGNLVLIGAEMATPGHTFPLLKILVFPAFVVGVALAKIIATRCQKTARNALLVLYVVEMLLLTFFMLVGLIAEPIAENMSDTAMLAGVIGAMTMGVHSACGRLVLPGLTPTGMMTGNVTQLVIEFVELIQGNGGKHARDNCARYLWPVITFGVGALLAAFAYFRFGFQALLLPIALVLVLACAEACSRE